MLETEKERRSASLLLLKSMKLSEQLIFIFFECKQQNDAEKTTGDDFSDRYGHCGKPHRDDAVSVF